MNPVRQKKRLSAWLSASLPLCSAAALLWLADFASAAVSEGAGGAVVDFNVAPVDFASVSIAGVSGDIFTVAALDADLANPAVAFSWPGAAGWTGIPDPTAPSTSDAVRYLSSGRMLFGPSGNRCSALVGQFQNNAGGPLGSLPPTTGAATSSSMTSPHGRSFGSCPAPRGRS